LNVHDKNVTNEEFPRPKKYKPKELEVIHKKGYDGRRKKVVQSIS
jgi:hypothetical protein